MDKDIRKPAPEGYISPLTGKAAEPHLFAADSEDLASISRALEKRPQRERDHDKIEILVDDKMDDEEATEKTPLLGESSKASTSKASGFSGILKKTGKFLQASTNAAASSSSAVVPANSNKRIVLPVRIEPKVFFANERTFLSWLHCESLSYPLDISSVSLHRIGWSSSRVTQFW